MTNAKPQVAKPVSSKPEKPVKKQNQAALPPAGKMILTTGKRKKAVARASFKPGTGRITFNALPLDKVENEMLRLRLQEPLMIAGDAWKSYDIKVNVRGGGTNGQVDAARQAIARGLVELTGDALKQKFMAMDRNLLVFDPRRTEPHKPPRSSQGPRRYKQRSKR